MAFFRPRPRGSRLTTVFDWLVVLPALIVPFFFVPLTSEWMALNKFALLTLFVLAAGAVWFARLIMQRTVETWTNPFWRLLGLFVLVAVIAWMFSPYRYTGFVGAPGVANHPLGQLLVVVAYAFLIGELSQPARLRQLLRCLVIGSSVVALYNILKQFGVEALPFLETTSASFTLLTNSTGILALVTAVAVVVALGLLPGESRRWQMVWLPLTALGMFLLLILDHSLGWIGLLSGTALVLLGRLRREDAASPRWVVGLSLAMALAVVFLLVPTMPLTPKAPVPDVVLDHATSTTITGRVLRQDPLFGWGPESFGYAFASERPRSFNNTVFWDLRFFKARSEFYQLLVSFGIVGTVTFFAFVLMLAGYCIHVMRQRRSGDGDEVSTTATAAWLVLVIALFFFPLNFATTFLFFLLVGVVLAAAKLRAGARTVKLEGGRQSLAVVGFSVFIIAAVTALFLGSRFWWAEMLYYRSVQGINKTEDLAKVEQRLTSAIGIHAWEPKYYFTLAKTELVRAQLELNKQPPDQTIAQQYVSRAAQAAQQGTAANPKTPETFEELASFYVSLQQSTGEDLVNAAIGSYGLASSLEPENPLHYSRAGQLELARSDFLQAQAAQTTGDEVKKFQDLRTTSLTDAQTFFAEALKHKTGFATARLGLALVQERQGKPDEALASIQNILLDVPNDVSTWFEFGRILKGQQRLDDAVVAFQQVVALAPGASDAFVNLGDLFAEQGKKDDAKQAYEAALQLVPNAQDVQTKLDGLQ